MQALGFLLVRTLIPSCGPTHLTSSDPNHLPEAPPPNTITLQGGYPHTDFERIQTFSS